jgi:predicted glutamine amidotransferase
MSSRTVDPCYLLTDATQSLLRQSDIDRKRKQGDGWGVVWFESGKPKIIKSQRPMFRDKAHVRRAGESARGRVLIGHVRWASNPLKLKRSELIGTVHTQPFVHGKWLFAHNGTLYIPKEVAAHLGSWKRYIRGKNDSEVLFYWLLKHLGQFKTPAKAVQQSIRGIERLWKDCKKSYPIHPFPFHGLNWVLTDGKILYAFCYTDPSGFGKSKALCDSRGCYYQLHKRITPDTVTVASEPLDTKGGWEKFRHGELLVVKKSENRIISQKLKVL